MLNKVGWRLLSFDAKSPDVIFNMRKNILGQTHIISQEVDNLIDQMISQNCLNKNKLDRKLYARRSQKQEQPLLEAAFQIFTTAISWNFMKESDWRYSCHDIALEFIINFTTNLRFGYEVYLESINLPKYKRIEDIEIQEEENNENNQNESQNNNRKIKLNKSRQDNLIDFCFETVPSLEDDLCSFIDRFKQRCHRKLQCKDIDKGGLPLMVAESKSDQGTLFEAENQLAEATIKMLVSLQVIGGEASNLPVLGIAMVGRSWSIYLTVASKDKIGQTIYITQPIWTGIVSKYRHAIEACSILRAFALWMNTTALEIILKCLKQIDESLLSEI